MQEIFNEVFTIVGMLERRNITHHVEWIGENIAHTQWVSEWPTFKCGHYSSTSK